MANRRAPTKSAIPDDGKPTAQPSAGPSAGSPVAAQKPGFFRRLSPLGRVIGGLVAAVSFVTGIVAVIPIFTADTTNFGSLRVSAAPFGEQLEYAVPATAAFDTFPAGTPGTCTVAQQRWLATNGRPIITRFLLDLRNVASSGAMLALKDFRGTGKASTSDQVIKVVCDPSGGSASSIQAARLLVSDPVQVAYFDKSAFNQTSEGIPDSPVVWNLAPGETGQLVVDLYPTKAFTGALTTTAFSGTDHRDFSIPIDSKGRIDVPALAFGGMTFIQVDGSLKCIRIDAGSQTPCALSDLLGK